jgi:Protein of unknown function (DUF3050)
LDKGLRLCDHSLTMKAIETEQEALVHHPVYQTFNDIEALRHFMEIHVFAVWDFMSLLKSLQRHLTCVELPWRPSKYPPVVVRLINQIVLGEESDVDPKGEVMSHFELYLKSMEEVGADTSRIREFLKTMNPELIAPQARAFVKRNLEVAREGHVVEVAASFFWGREKLIPNMFQSVVNVLKKENVQAPTLLYYLERHIEVDEGEHGPLALQCLDYLMGESEELKLLGLRAGTEALALRRELWDATLKSLYN